MIIYTTIDYVCIKQPRKIIQLTNEDLIISSYEEHAVVWYKNCLEYKRFSVQNPRGIVVDYNKLYVCSYGDPTGSITCIDIRNKSVLWNSTCFRPRGITLEKSILYTTEVNTGNIVLHEKQNGNMISYLQNIGLKNPRGITIMNNVLYVADSGNDRIVKILKNGSLLKYYKCKQPNDVAHNYDKIAVSEWYQRNVVIFTFDLLPICSCKIENATFLTMLTFTVAGDILVGDNQLDTVHKITFTDSEISEKIY